MSGLCRSAAALAGLFPTGRSVAFAALTTAAALAALVEDREDEVLPRAITRERSAHKAHELVDRQVMLVAERDLSPEGIEIRIARLLLILGSSAERGERGIQLGLPFRAEVVGDGQLAAREAIDERLGGPDLARPKRRDDRPEVRRAFGGAACGRRAGWCGRRGGVALGLGKEAEAGDELDAEVDAGRGAASICGPRVASGVSAGAQLNDGFCPVMGGVR
jgi:hypothetical protein